jgi:hypothetical protein
MVNRKVSCFPGRNRTFLPLKELHSYFFAFERLFEVEKLSCGFKLYLPQNGVFGFFVLRPDLEVLFFSMGAHRDPPKGKIMRKTHQFFRFPHLPPTEKKKASLSLRFFMP